MKLSARLLLPLVVFSLLLFFCWSGLGKDPRALDSPLINQPLPSFKKTSLENQVLMTEQDFQGNISLLHVFNNHNPSWRIECALLMSLSLKGVRVVGLDYKDNSEETLKALRNTNPYYAIISDKEGQLGMQLGVYGTPETFVIDAKGIVRDRLAGPVTWDNLQNEIEPLIERLKREKR